MKSTIRTTLTVLALATTAGVGLAQAEARIDNVYGLVSLNQGEGFTPVLGSIPVNPGDRVMADKGGSATVIYSETCKVPVKPGVVVVVMSRAPCLQTSAAIEQGGSHALNGDSDWIVPAAAGAGIVGGGVALFLLLDDDDNGRKGVSP